MWHRFDFPAERQLCSLALVHIFCHMLQEGEGGTHPHPQPPCVSRSSHTDSRTPAVLQLHFPVQLEHQRAAPVEPKSTLSWSFALLLGWAEKGKRCTFQKKILPPDTYPSRIVSEVAPHWLGLEDSLCEWHNGGLAITAVCCTPPPPPPVPRPQHVLLRLSNTAPAILE